MIGAGGVSRRRGYLAEARAICRERGVLFVADEVITGFGRIGGAWFASPASRSSPTSSSAPRA